MHITLQAIRWDRPFSLARDGDKLALNGSVFDFAGLADGALLPREALDSDLFAAAVERRDGVVHVTLLLPYGAEASDERINPVPIGPDDASTLLGDMPEEPTQGAIDWSQMLTAEQRAEAAKPPVPIEISAMQFSCALMLRGELTAKEAKDWAAKGITPKKVQAAVDLIADQPLHDLADLRVASATTYRRDDWAVEMLAALLGYDDAFMRGLFTEGAAL